MAGRGRCAEGWPESQHPRRSLALRRAAAALNTEGTALAKLGAYADAEPLLVASLPGLEKSQIPGLPGVGRKRLRELYLAWGRPAEAARYR